MSSKSTPRVGMKVMFPFQVSACCWVDLLGYGSAIRAADYNPLNPAAREAVDRIRAFHQIVADHSARSYPTLVMNDGAIAYRDLSYRSRWPTYDFLQRSLALFREIQAVEEQAGFPGARMVLATGFRLRGRGSQSSADRGVYVKRLLKKLEKGGVTAKEAITKASQYRKSFDVIPQLQANFAFTKAYVVESSGTSGGFPGPKCYVDGLFFAHEEIEEGTFRLGSKIEWASEDYGMSGDFYELHSIQAAKQTQWRGGKNVHHRSRGVRDALEVAEKLAGDKNVLEALRAAQKSSSC